MQENGDVKKGRRRARNEERVRKAKKGEEYTIISRKQGLSVPS